MNEPLIAALSVLGTLLLTSVYGLMTTAIRKRVSMRSPESRILEQIVPAVNHLLEMQGKQTIALVALLEAQKGICNGNVDAALEEARASRKSFDAFLLNQAKVV